jgi:Peptidase family M20/M25/M40/Peptidase dimerisation domain
MAARLRAAGFSGDDVQVFKPAPRKGNLVARLRGTGARKPILLVAHLDVVEALASDWSFDPFKLTEKDGYFYGRGSGDDKFMAATFVANLIRYKQENFIPNRDIILALETDEEIGDSDGLGIQWLIKNHRDLIEAEYALNEGGGVGIKNGKLIGNSLQTMEKVYLNYRLEVLNKGGHSSVPSTDNAIYHLAEGLARLGKFSFPVNLNTTTRAYLARTAELESSQTAADIRSVLSASPDPAALARLSANPAYNAQLRTTCVATMLEGGHAVNALPQTARALVNCAGRELRRHQVGADPGVCRRPDHCEASGQRKSEQPCGDRRGTARHDREDLGRVLARRAGRADHERRGDRRPLSTQRRHSHLRPLGARRRRRRRASPRQGRTRRGQVVLRRRRISLPPCQAVVGRNLTATQSAERQPKAGHRAPRELRVR